MSVLDGPRLMGSSGALRDPHRSHFRIVKSVPIQAKESVLKLIDCRENWIAMYAASYML